jgi:hypothetical protein
MTALIPALMCVSPHGLVLHIEMKRPASSRNPRGRVRKAQKERLIEWRRRGVPCCVADGVTPALQALCEFTTAGPWMDDACDRLMEPYEWWPA